MKIDEIAEKIKKQFGDDSIRTFDEIARKVPVCTTGCCYLDWILGTGGLPLGRIVEIWGGDGTGKTTIVYHIIAAFQKKGAIAAFLDVENGFDPKYAKRLGVDLKNLLLPNMDTAEEWLEMLIEIIANGRGLMIVALDSVASLLPEAELDGGSGGLGLQARILSKLLKRVVNAAKGKRVGILLTNQVREKIGVMYGNPEFAPGGRALRHYASIILYLQSRGFLKVSEKRVGVKVNVRCAKSKLAVPYRSGVLEMPFGEGVNKEKAIIDCAVETGVVKKRKGGVYVYGDVSARGCEGFIREAGRKTLAKILKQIRS